MADTAEARRDMDDQRDPGAVGGRAEAQRRARGAFRRHAMLWGGGAFLFNMILGWVALGSLVGGVVFGLVGLALAVGLAAVEGRMSYRQGLRPSRFGEGLGVARDRPGVDGQTGASRGRMGP